jgi:sugar O-acyltransferase (sialic acid O-acetyltransferase NeuD family)
MTESYPITIPLLNPNEPGALIASLQIIPGQHVHQGDRLCTLETTKSTAELTAETDGFVVGLAFEAGQTIQSGEILCYLAESPDWSPPAAQEKSPIKVDIQSTGMRISQPALLLVQQHNLDVSHLPADIFITEKMVQELISSSIKSKIVLPNQLYASNAIIVYGAGGHGKALIDLIRILGSYSIAGIVDDDPATGSSIMEVPVLGDGNILDLLIEKGVHLAVNAVGGIGNIHSRVKVFDRLSQAGFSCPALVHPTAFVEPSATLEDGVQVMPHAYVGSEARLGFGAIVNTGAIVSHDCILGDYVNLSPGAILAGEVNIGSAALVGMGVTVNLRVNIGEHARIGNGSTIKQDVPAGGIVHAGTIWPG